VEQLFSSHISMLLVWKCRRLQFKNTADTFVTVVFEWPKITVLKKICILVTIINIIIINIIIIIINF